VKKLIVIIVVISTFNIVNAQKNSECDKLFWKEKNSSKKSSVFSENTAIKTKYANFYADGRRQIAFLYERNENNKLNMSFTSIYIGEGFKNEIRLGQNIRIAFIFSDGTNHIFQFESNPLEDGSNVKSHSNSIPLDDDILNLLKSKTVVEVQLKNPFNAVGDGVVRTESVNKKQAERINQISSCFQDRINN